jgi:hypothetical protein
VTGGLRKQHNVEFHYIYCSPIIIRIIKSSRMRWAEHVAQRGNRNACRLLVVKPEGKRPLERPRRVWMDNIKMALTLDGVVRTGLFWLRNQWTALVNTAMNFLVP